MFLNADLIKNNMKSLYSVSWMFSPVDMEITAKSRILNYGLVAGRGIVCHGTYNLANVLNFWIQVRHVKSLDVVTLYSTCKKLKN